MNAAQALLLTALGLASASAQGGSFVYFGTYTGRQSKGIYVSRFDAGKLSEPVLAGELSNPSFLAVHPNGRVLYAVSEMREGTVAAFAIDPATGQLAKIGERSSGGSGPCYLSVDHSGRVLMVANYNSGTLEALALDKNGNFGDGTFTVAHHGSSVNPQRQRGPHAHSIDPSPDNRFAIADDLGMDKVMVYRLNTEKPALEPNEPPAFDVKPGSGPRHFAFAPNGKFAYVISELASTVTALAWDGERGKLTEVQTVSTLPEDFQGQSTAAEIAVHPSGKFVYGSNRGHDSIAVFAVDGAKGTLKPVERVPSGGSVPRGFAVDPSGRWLIAANQQSNNAVLFRIDKKTGKLTPSGTTLAIGSPVSVLLVAAGK